MKFLKNTRHHHSKVKVMTMEKSLFIQILNNNSSNIKTRKMYMNAIHFRQMSFMKVQVYLKSYMRDVHCVSKQIT